MGFRVSQDTLRIFLYISAGWSVAIFPWYFGYPLLVVGVILAQVVENINTRIEQIKNIPKITKSNGGNNNGRNKIQSTQTRY